MKKLGIALPEERCATFSREGGMGDVLYCRCTHPAHSSLLLPESLHIEVGSL